MAEQSKWMRAVVLCGLCLLLSIAAVPMARADETVRIGVLAKRGTERALELWGPTAEYLADHIPGRRFEVVPLDFEHVRRAVAESRVDFIITNSGYYIELESAFGVSRIATLKNLLGNEVSKVFGGVIFTRADRADLNDLKDLRGRTFMGVEPRSFGGWQTGLLELRRADVNPDYDFSVLSFGGTHDSVVYAVRDGRVDAGTVRTDTLERMQAEGRIRVSDFKVLAARAPTPEFPFRRSTSLYPEWPWAKLRHTPDELAEQVTIALLAMKKETPAARTARIAGWTVPLDYQPIHALMKELKIGPYINLGRLTPGQVIREYYAYLLAGVLLVAALSLAFGYVARLNRNLERTRTDLDNQLTSRLEAEEALGRAYDELELRVHRRTSELSDANERLIEENTERKRVEAELRQQKDYIDNIIQTAPALILTLDKTARIDEFNSYAENLTGWTKSDVAGRDFVELFIPRLARERYERRLMDFIRSGAAAWESESELLPREGPPRIISWRYSLLSGIEGGDPAVIGIGLDVTDRRRAEEHSRLQNEQLIQADKMVALGTLVAGVAHEINNPTTSIMMNAPHIQKMWANLAEILDERFEAEGDFEVGGWLYSEVRERLPRLLEGILDGSRRVKRIVADLKDYARHEGTSGAEPVDVNRVVERAISLLSNLIRKSTGAFQVDYGDDLPMVMARSQRLEQVVINLIMNACEALESEEAGVFVSTALRVDENSVEIVVRDEGPGIPEQNLARLFDPFFTTKRKSGGTGLGLAICSRIMDDHGGGIRFLSPSTGGTIVTVTLPAAPA